MKGAHFSVPAVAIAGWLFADLLLAFLIITLGTDSGPSAGAAAAAEAAGQSPDGAPEEEALPQGLELDPVVVEVNTAPSTVASGGDEAVGLLEGELADVADREVGMVLTFGGSAQGKAFAEDINDLLPRAHPEAFEDAVTRAFHDLGKPVGWARIEIYLFAETP